LLHTGHHVRDDTVQADLTPIITAAQQAEELGFHHVWIGDSSRMERGWPRADCLTVLAALAMKTERIRLGVIPLNAPLRNPVLLAHQLATVDVLSGGRLLVSPSSGKVGPEGQREFANCNGPTSAGAQIIIILICPSDPLPQTVSTFVSGGTTYYFGMNSYGGNGGTRSWYISNMTNDGMFWVNSRVRMTDITDGTSNTLLFGERWHWDPVYTAVNTLGGWAWANYSASQDYLLSAPVPVNYTLTPGVTATQQMQDDRACAYGSAHTGGANFAFGDGSVRFLTLTSNSDLALLQAISTRASGEAVSLP